MHARMSKKPSARPAREPTPLAVTWQQVTAFRLARHHLVARAPAAALAAVAGAMGGAQAQVLSAAQLSLRARVQGLRAADVEQAVSDRRLVRAACMRRTLFLVPSDELAVFVRGTARRAEKGVGWALGKGVPERVLERVMDAALGVLDEPLTRPEIADRVCRALAVPARTVPGGGWGRRSKNAAVPVGHLNYPVADLLHLAAARGVVCYGPNRGSEPTFVRGDAWAPHWHDVTTEEAEGLLLRKYLRAFGPATAADFSLWTGISLTGAREIWAREQPGFAPVTVDGWTAAVLADDAQPLATAGYPRPLVRLLPYFDTFLLGHKTRDHLVANHHRRKIYRPQGWITPVVLVDGRAAGVWAQARQGNALCVKVTALAPLTRRIAAAIRSEARDLARFLAAPAPEVEIGTVDE